jgi:hypothetical protein
MFFDLHCLDYKVHSIEVLNWNCKLWVRPRPVFRLTFAIPARISPADPFLRRWEGGISGRDGVSTTASNGAGANPNCEEKSGVREINLIAKVIVRVTAKVTKSTINLAVRLDVTLDVTLIGRRVPEVQERLGLGRRPRREPPRGI